jgi:hypothetical protein
MQCRISRARRHNHRSPSQASEARDSLLQRILQGISVSAPFRSVASKNFACSSKALVIVSLAGLRREFLANPQEFWADPLEQRFVALL